LRDRGCDEIPAESIFLSFYLPPEAGSLTHSCISQTDPLDFRGQEKREGQPIQSFYKPSRFPSIQIFRQPIHPLFRLAPLGTTALRPSPLPTPLICTHRPRRQCGSRGAGLPSLPVGCAAAGDRRHRHDQTANPTLTLALFVRVFNFFYFFQIYFDTNPFSLQIVISVSHHLTTPNKFAPA